MRDIHPTYCLLLVPSRILILFFHSSVASFALLWSRHQSCSVRIKGGDTQLAGGMPPAATGLVGGVMSMGLFLH
jgi:hypothetical protein